jgi:hypothetical protein
MENETKMTDADRADMLRCALRSQDLGNIEAIVTLMEEGETKLPEWVDPITAIIYGAVFSAREAHNAYDELDYAISMLQRARRNL